MFQFTDTCAVGRAQCVQSLQPLAPHLDFRYDAVDALRVLLRRQGDSFVASIIGETNQTCWLESCRYFTNWTRQQLITTDASGMGAPEVTIPWDPSEHFYRAVKP
jgi:hypothetical protein